MNIYIMSRGRAGKVNTYKWIPESWQDRTRIVCSHNEFEDYAAVYSAQVMESPEWVTNYSQKVQWILDGFPETPEDKFFSINTSWNEEDPKALIMDDDLVFSSFNADGRLLTIRDSEVLIPMFEQIKGLLDEFALVGVHPRQNAVNAKDKNGLNYELNGRIICIQGINRAKIGMVKVDQFPILADVVLNCSLLARGKANAILTSFFQDHGPCQAPGGCSIYRTPEMQRTAVEYLASRFPGFVKVMIKTPKAAKWMGDTRYDYQCQWKKLYAAGAAHILDKGTIQSPDLEARGIAETVE